MVLHYIVPIGKVFSQLTVLEDDGTRMGTSVAWKCRCSCGKITHVRGSALTHGQITSCGHAQHAKICEVTAADFARSPEGTRLSLLTEKANKNSQLGMRNISKVYRNGYEKFRVSLTYQGKTHDGIYDTLERAGDARERLRKKYWPNYGKD
jgi:hypothetical protein